MAEQFVGKTAEFKDGDRRIVFAGDNEIGVFKHEGQFYAYSNVCLHQGGPACEGLTIAKVEERLRSDKTSQGLYFSETQMNFVCPWHGMEYDMKTGECISDRKMKLRKYKIVEKGETNGWLREISEWKKKYPLLYKEKKKLLPQYIIQQISEATKGEAVVATGVGQHQMWAAQFYQFNKPRSFLSSGGLGTMGYGLPAAIGAAFGRPDEIIFDIDGDGSFEMTLNEIATAVSNKLKIKVAILNNRHHGMVRQWQDLFYKGRHAQSELIGQPDFAKLAEAYGAVGITITKREEVRPAIEKALKTPKTVIMNFFVEENEDCWPMIAPGKPANEMLGTFEALQKEGAVPQPRKFKEEAPEDLSLS